MMQYNSQEQIEQRAEKIRTLLGLEKCEWLDVQTVLMNMRRVFPGVEYQFIDEELPNNALAQWNSKDERILIPRNTFAGANFPTHDPRCRFSIFHEVIHVFEGHQGILYRAQSRSNIPSYAKGLKSVERQTDAITAAFIAPMRLIKSNEPVESISLRFGLSKQAALLRVDESRKLLGVGRRRPSYVEDLLRELSGHKESYKPLYHDKDCKNCGEKKLIPIGIGYLCEGCDSPQVD